MRLIRKKDWNQFEIIVRAGKLTKIATNCVQEIKDLCRFRLWFTFHARNKIDIKEVMQYPSGRICPLGGTDKTIHGIGGSLMTQDGKRPWKW